VIVELPSGEVFAGPWTDDPSIGNDVVAYRRLRSDWVERLVEGYRVKSAAFQPHRESSSISVTLADVAEQLGLAPRDVALGEFVGEYGLATFLVGDARSTGLHVRRVPLSVDSGHAMLFAAHPETGECPNSRHCRRLGKVLASMASVDLAPPEIERTEGVPG